MTEHAKPTPGPWFVRGKTANLQIAIVGPSGELSDSIAYAWGQNGEAEANARLIAEAGTVHHETGLTPRQLVEQRAELLEALAAISQMRDGNPSDAMADMPPLDYARHIMAEMRREARTAIAKARGGSDA